MPPAAGDLLICVCVPAVCPQAELAGVPSWLAVQQQGDGFRGGFKQGKAFKSHSKGLLGQWEWSWKWVAMRVERKAAQFPTFLTTPSYVC